jgi:hypothetical protein
MLDAAVKISAELSSSKLQNLQIANYFYTPDQAIEELGLDAELVDHLLEDYVTQVVKSNMIFLQHLEFLKAQEEQHKFKDYTALRELAHKNLGVARNLRILDAEKLLYEIMTREDLDYIFTCLEALFACVTKLKPQEAFNTLKLIKIKNSL